MGGMGALCGSSRRPHRHRNTCRRVWLLLLVLVLIVISILGMENAVVATWLADETLLESNRRGWTNGHALANKKQPTTKRFAYAFYATTSAYACGAFVQVAQLRDLGTPVTIDFVLL